MRKRNSVMIHIDKTWLQAEEEKRRKEVLKEEEEALDVQTSSNSLLAGPY
jgi:hypothetical protein